MTIEFMMPEPVVYALKWSHDSRLNLSVVFDTPDEKQNIIVWCGMVKGVIV